MARCFVYLTFVVMNIVVNALSENSSITAPIFHETEERTLKFSFRFSRNHRGRWVTQTELQREGFPERGFVPRVQFSLEQSLDASTDLSHFVARIAASSSYEKELVIGESKTNERFDLVVRNTDYFTASSECLASGQRLAVPTQELISWLEDVKEWCFSLSIRQFFVGINNLENNERFRTERGKMVMNHGVPLEPTESFPQCGVIHFNGREYNLTTEDCDERRPFLCEFHEETNEPEENVDVGGWLETTELYRSSYETNYEYY